MPEAPFLHLSTVALLDNSRYRPRLIGNHHPCEKKLEPPWEGRARAFNLAIYIHSLLWVCTICGPALPWMGGFVQRFHDACGSTWVGPHWLQKHQQPSSHGTSTLHSVQSLGRRIVWILAASICLMSGRRSYYLCAVVWGVVWFVVACHVLGFNHVASAHK